MNALSDLSRLAWNLVKAKFSPGDIAEVLKKEFSLPIVGRREVASAFRQALTGDGVIEDLEARFPIIEALPSEDEERDKLRQSLGAVILITSSETTFESLEAIAGGIPENLRFLIVVRGEEECLEGDEINWWGRDLDLPPFVWARDFESLGKTKLPARLLDDFHLMEMPLARSIPILRDETARRLTVRTAVQNMAIALASSLPSSIPVVGIIASAIAVTGETIFLTANQIKLCLKIAGLYGFEVDLLERLKELWPVLGGAFTWRSLARSGVGLVPVAGPIIKAALAYAGTYVTGEAAQWFYARGIRMSAEDQKAIFLKAKDEALAKAQDLLNRFKESQAAHDGRPLSETQPVSETQPPDEAQAPSEMQAPSETQPCAQPPERKPRRKRATQDLPREPEPSE
jgi:uncharacterized protein (DUF697 family)